MVTWEHLLHVDFALLEQVSEPLPVLQFGRLLQAQKEEWEVGAVLQGVSQLCHAHQLRDDGPGRELSQVGLHQRHVHLDLRALVQDIQEGLRSGWDISKSPSLMLFFFLSDLNVVTNLHEVLSSDEALGAKRVDQSADVLLVLVGTIQGEHDDLAEHLR